MRSFILILTFMTRLPWPVTFDFNEKDFARGLWYMPVIGFVIGIPLWTFMRYIPIDNPYLMGFLTIIIYISLTGGLHLDGLADYFDGIFSGRSKERILEIMKDVHSGTFGAIGLVLYFLGFFVMLIGAEPLMILLMPVTGRCMGFITCAFGKYPREKGMGMAFIDYGKPWMGFLMITLLVIVSFAAGPVYLIASGVVVLFAGIVIARTSALIGGVTGDVIGAVIEMSQVVWLLVFAVERSLV